MTRKKILLIDDEPGIRQVIEVTFRILTPWETLVAHDGPTGIALAANYRPDAILLDVMLPGMDGIAVLNRLRENPLTRSIPIILLTAKARAGDRARLAALPIAGIIIKPFKADDLVRQTRSILGWEDRAIAIFE